MLVGMGTVFSFLTLLVFVTSGMSALVQRFVTLPQGEGSFVPSKTTSSHTVQSNNPTDEEIVAITAALTAFRESTHQNKKS